MMMLFYQLGMLYYKEVIYLENAKDIWNEK